MSGPGHELPRILVVAMASLALLAVVGVAYLRLSDQDPTTPLPAFTASQQLTFIDGPEASVVVRNPEGEEVTRYARGTNAFARVLLRAMARERRRHGFDLTAPFELARDARGSIYLIDPLTPTRITLDAFGETNAQVFDDLLEAALQVST